MLSNSELHIDSLYHADHFTDESWCASCWTCWWGDGCRPTSLLPDKSGKPLEACVYLLFVQFSRYFRKEPFLEACALYKIFVHIACMLWHQCYAVWGSFIVTDCMCAPSRLYACGQNFWMLSANWLLIDCNTQINSWTACSCCPCWSWLGGRCRPTSPSPDESGTPLGAGVQCSRCFAPF